MNISQSFRKAKRRGAPPDAPGGANHPATPSAATSTADNGRGCEAGADRITAGRQEVKPAKPRKSEPRRKKTGGCEDHTRLRDVPLAGGRQGDPGTTLWKERDAAFVRAVIREGRRLGLL